MSIARVNAVYSDNRNISVVEQVFAFGILGLYKVQSRWQNRKLNTLKQQRVHLKTLAVVLTLEEQVLG